VLIIGLPFLLQLRIGSLCSTLAERNDLFQYCWLGTSGRSGRAL
jgi:hypothetical protein